MSGYLQRGTNGNVTKINQKKTPLYQKGIESTTLLTLKNLVLPTEENYALLTGNKGVGGAVVCVRRGNSTQSASSSSIYVFRRRARSIAVTRAGQDESMEA